MTLCCVTSLHIVTCRERERGRDGRRGEEGELLVRQRSSLAPFICSCLSATWLSYMGHCVMRCVCVCVCVCEWVCVCVWRKRLVCWSVLCESSPSCWRTDTINRSNQCCMKARGKTVLEVPLFLPTVLHTHTHTHTHTYNNISQGSQQLS